MDDDNGRGECLTSARSKSVISANIVRQWFVDRILYDEALIFGTISPSFPAQRSGNSVLFVKTTLVDEPRCFRSPLLVSTPQKLV
mmetsp:Transcript_61686/g.123696  ORF Transcript_61686/g.123696 Transcript_61686/m.123696 type:complete len:85 (-) Transcript_61686:19-273(-)